MKAISYFHIRTWKFGAASGALAILLVVGISAAAEYTAPGDVLYPVKVRVNEEVLSQLSLSPYERVEWETRRVERRIAEARLLAKEGKLTEEVEAQITGAVMEHAESARQGLQELREENADEAAVAQVVLESALDVQTAVLANDEASRDENDDTIKQLANAVADTQETLRLERASTTLSSYERFRGSVEEATTRAHELFLSISPSLDEAGRTDIERRLEDINRQIVLAEEQHGSEAADTAVEGLKEALGSTQKLISYMTDIDVRISVELETLVPKKLTQEERVLRAGERREALVSTLTLVRERMASSTEPQAVTEKISFGLKSVDEAINAVDIALSNDELDAAERILSEGEAMASDLQTMTEEAQKPKTETILPEEIPPAETSSTTGADSSTTPEVAGN